MTGLGEVGIETNGAITRIRTGTVSLLRTAPPNQLGYDSIKTRHSAFASPDRIGQSFQVETGEGDNVTPDVRRPVLCAFGR